VLPLSAFCIALGKVLLIGGPTASGKSGLALEKARALDGVIINGDSLQVYRGLEILTAQPSPQECQEVPHRLYGFLDPSQTFSVGKWLSLVNTEIEAALKDNKLPIVVGGTGLYLKSLRDGISEIPAIDPQIRKQLKNSQEENYAELKKVDPLLAERLSPQDRQRTQRGLEVFYGTGKPLSFWQTRKPLPSPYEFDICLLMPSKAELEKRITLRLQKMLEQGVLDEIARLRLNPLSLQARKAIGFQEFEAYLKGETSFEDALELTLIHTRQYAKRQLTWFRHQFKNT
jgi:tRNA dimethylallyltransferase